MFYTYCPTLMIEIPQKTVDTLISLGRWQSPLFTPDSNLTSTHQKATERGTIVALPALPVQRGRVGEHPLPGAPHLLPQLPSHPSPQPPRLPLHLLGARISPALPRITHPGLFHGVRAQAVRGGRGRRDGEGGGHPLHLARAARGRRGACSQDRHRPGSQLCCWQAGWPTPGRGDEQKTLVKGLPPPPFWLIIAIYDSGS